MIEALSPGSPSPQTRAAMIYGEAQSAMAARLWQAALGNTVDTPAADRPRATPVMDDLVRTLLTVAEKPVATTPRDAAAPKDAVATDPAATRHRMRGDAVASGARLGGLGANARYAPILDAAAARTGIPAPALAAIVDAEAGKARDGSWRTLSRNPRSSAAGLGQFLSRTWEGLAETRGTWLNGTARAQGWLDARGQVTPESRTALLALRYRPDAAIEGIADFARRNLAGLERAGVSGEGEIGATARLAYLGHHLGLRDAVRFLRDGGLEATHARVLLTAQVGAAGSEARIATAGDATAAHRSWLLAYLDRNVRADRYATNAAL